MVAAFELEAGEGDGFSSFERFQSAHQRGPCWLLCAQRIKRGYEQPAPELSRQVARVEPDAFAIAICAGLESLGG